jgi:hypothetical protein
MTLCIGAIRRVTGHPDNVEAEIVFADVKVVQLSRSLEWLYLVYDEDFTHSARTKRD